MWKIHNDHEGKYRNQGGEGTNLVQQKLFWIRQQALMQTVKYRQMEQNSSSLPLSLSIYLCVS